MGKRAGAEKLTNACTDDDVVAMEPPISPEIEINSMVNLEISRLNTAYIPSAHQHKPCTRELKTNHQCQLVREINARSDFLYIIARVTRNTMIPNSVNDQVESQV